jgi:PleD family two-component response regulator
MPNTDEMQAGRAILHLQQELAEYTTDVQGAQYTIRASFGLAAAKEGEKLESVIARADKAMYVNKLLTNR